MAGVTNAKGKEWGILRKLFLREEHSDLKICIQYEKNSLDVRFPCHMDVLKVASEKVRESPNDNLLFIDDVRVDAMAALLEFIYFGTVKLEGWEFTRDLLEAASSLQVRELCEVCERSLSKEINATNLCDILDTAFQTGSAMLKDACLKACEGITFETLNKKAFRESGQSTVEFILSVRKMHAGLEMILFKSVWEWGAWMCCRNCRKVSEDNIAEVFEGYVPAMGLERMSDGQISSIPSRVVEHFQRLCPTVSLPKQTQNKRSDRERDPQSWREHEFLYDEFCDCEIIVEWKGSRYRFPCRKNVVSDSSRSFVKRFESASAKGGDAFVEVEGFSSKEKRILVKGISPSAMHSLLTFLSVKKLELKGIKSACEVYTAAHKYKFLEILPQCLRYMRLHLTAVNVCFVLDCAISGELFELTELCKNFVSESDIHEVVSSRAFNEMSLKSFIVALEYPCFEAHNIRLSFATLWKRTLVHCCQKVLPTDLETIGKHITVMLKFVDLSSLSLEELECIPKSERERLHLGRTKEPAEACALPVEVEEGYTKTFWATNRNFKEVFVKEAAVLFRFSINQTAYLHQFSVSHLGPPMFSKLHSMHIYKTEKTLAMFVLDGDENDLLMTAVDSPDERTLTFKALKPLLIEDHSEHVVEVNYGDAMGNLIWAVVSLERDKDGDFEINMLSERCYGLNYLSFLPTA